MDPGMFVYVITLHVRFCLISTLWWLFLMGSRPWFPRNDGWSFIYLFIYLRTSM